MLKRKTHTKIHFFLLFNICRFTKEKIKVTLGEYSFDQDDETLVQEKIGIRNMKNHEKYNDKTFENDIALIRLDRKVQFSKSVYPICLPPKGTDFTDTRAFVVGKFYSGAKMISTLFRKKPCFDTNGCQYFHLFRMGNNIFWRTYKFCSSRSQC